jgi:hypothetical protein
MILLQRSSEECCKTGDPMRVFTVACLMTMMCCAAASAKDLRVVTCGAARAAPSGVEVVRLHGRDCGPKEARVTVNVRGNTIDRIGPSGGQRLTSVTIIVK